MGTEALATAAFMDKLLSIYKNDANFTNVPPRTLSIDATVTILEQYANLCGVPLNPALHTKIEQVIEAFRVQWLRECPRENDTSALVKLFDTPQCKHRICVSLCIISRR
jgi:hypothetical protein